MKLSDLKPAVLDSLVSDYARNPDWFGDEDFEALTDLVDRSALLRALLRQWAVNLKEPLEETTEEERLESICLQGILVGWRLGRAVEENAELEALLGDQ